MGHLQILWYMNHGTRTYTLIHESWDTYKYFDTWIMGHVHILWYMNPAAILHAVNIEKICEVVVFCIELQVFLCTINFFLFVCRKFNSLLIFSRKKNKYNFWNFEARFEPAAIQYFLNWEMLSLNRVDQHENDKPYVCRY